MYISKANIIRLFACIGSAVLSLTLSSTIPARAAEASEASVTLTTLTPSPTTPTRSFARVYNVYFRQDAWVIDTTYQGNAATLRLLRSEIDSLMTARGVVIDSIIIESAASPDGGSAYNRRLSELRGRSAAELVRRLCPELGEGRIGSNSLGEDWSSLRSIALSDENMPAREELLSLIDSELSDDAKERRLRSMRATFRYIIDNHIHSMRVSAVTLRILLPQIEIASLDPITTTIRTQETGGLAAATTTGRNDQSQTLPFNNNIINKQIVLALRSNLLIPALNIGAEIPIGNDWSLGLDYYYPWWLAKSNKYCAEMLGWFIDCKRWIGEERTAAERLTGHAVGFYAGAGYYDYQWLDEGAQGEYLDLGIDYTYAIPIAKDRLRMEFNIGVGWIGTRLRRYNPTEDYVDLIKEPGVLQRRYSFFGPTRASVSILVPIRAKIKGGGSK